MHCIAPVLFESSDHHAVLQDPVNQDWVGLVGAIDGEHFAILARRYYLALQHFRKQRTRPPLPPGQLEIVAEGKQQALSGMLAAWEQRLRDVTKSPPPLRVLLAGPGRPPCDAFRSVRSSVKS